MRPGTWAIPLALLAVTAVPVRATDLTKIDRTIAKEPAYRNKPTYCLLVFGPEAKARAWLVIDGTTLYVDRGCNGDLTGPGKQVDVTRVVDGGPQNSPKVEAGDITEPDGKTKHTHLVIGRYVNMNVSIAIAGKQRWYAGSDSNDLIFAEQPRDAPVIHFGGPMTLGLSEFRARNRPVPGKDYHLECFIGTPGLGKSTFARIKALDMPKGARATAVFNFPNPKPGADPLIRTMSLKPDD